MTEGILLDIVWVFLLGAVAQWLAWRFRMPSILLLLVFGFVAGPISGEEYLLNPQLLAEADWLFAFVSIAVGIILFEGGLTLRLDELREVGRSVLNLITVGVFVTWALAGLGAFYLVESYSHNVSLSVLTGAILTVTGPTVVVPLLRHVRPEGRVGTISKWEGITIDPVGAILSVLVLETILLLHESGVVGLNGEAIFHALQGIFRVAVVSVGISTIGAALLVLLLRRRLIPDFLLNPMALTIVVTAFALSNELQHESGLLTATLMGIMLANQSYASVRRIVEFKEDLQVLLVATLFILLSARLEMSVFQYVDASSLVFLGFLILVVRPLAAVISSVGTKLNWREVLFISWLAPRGIVAAAVASLFAYRLQEGLPEAFPEEVVAPVVPTVFLVIVGTVAVYGLTLAPLARWLGLADQNPQGVLFVGAHAWARRLAGVLQEHDIKVLLVDSNPEVVRCAREAGLPAQQANVLSEGVMEQLNLNGIGRLVAITANDEVNSLAALHFAEFFDSTEVYQLPARTQLEPAQESSLPMHLRGRSLFGAEATYQSLSERFDRGAQIQSLQVQDGLSFEQFREHFGDQVLPLFLVRSQKQLLIVSDDAPPTPQPGDTMLVLADPEAQEENLRAAPNLPPAAEELEEPSAQTDGAAADEDQEEPEASEETSR